jgi:hypothetical protein
VFYALLNVAGINAIVIFSSGVVAKGEKAIQRKKFLLSLGQQMVIPWIQRKSAVQTIHAGVENLSEEVPGGEAKEFSNINKTTILSTMLPLPKER